MRLLITAGGSTHCELALHLAAHLLQARQAKEAPTILTVIAHEAERPQADAMLGRARELLGPQAPEVRTKIRRGRPAEEIIREAEEGEYDLVIVGERPVHRLMARFLGSTTMRVLEGVSCPVIIAKGRIGSSRRILLCDSGAESSSLLNRFTTQLAALVEGEVEITILHVMSQMSAGPGVDSQELRADARELMGTRTPEGELLARDVQFLEKLDIHPQPKVRHGLVVDEIVAEARSGNYDLVVIGAYHRQGGWGLLLDNLARQIIAKLDRPVLVVR